MTTQNPLVSFSYEGSALRVEQGADGEPLFHAGDLCAILGYANPHDAINRHIDMDDIVKRESVRIDGAVFMENFVREPGMWSLIMGSHAANAKPVKRWVTAEVLPSIRKTGSYVMPGAKPSTPQIPAHTRFLATHDGTAWWLKEIPANAFVMPAEDWPKVIKTDDFPRELLPSVLSAASERMLSIPASTAFKSPGPYIAQDPAGPEACLNHLLNATLRVDGKPPATVRDLIRAGDSRALGRYGLRKIGTNFLISNTNEMLERHVFAGSPWAGGWRKELAKLPGASKPRTVFKIGGHVSRCVCVSLSIE